MFKANQDNAKFNAQRQQLLAYMLKLKSAIDHDTPDLAEALTQRFCDSVVDYLSAGHFQIFQRYVPASHEYGAIEHTTRELMRFNDRFGNGGPLNLAELGAALEQVAYVIDTRMELEDELIRARSVPRAARRHVAQGAYAYV